MSKVIVITGTSSGLGLATAVQFAQKGHSVYATMRNLDKKDDLLTKAAEKGVSVLTEEMDVTNIESINSCIARIIEKECRIDILVNNAGAGFAKSTEQATYEEIEWVTEVNYLSVVYTTKAVIPYMRKQRSGHIINITSVGGLVGQPFSDLYSGAKFAVEGYTEALACYLTEPFGIHFTAVEPGGISSEFMKSVTKKMGLDQGMPEDEYAPILQKYLGGMQKRAAAASAAAAATGTTTKPVHQTPDQVAEVVVQVAENPDPPIRIRTSEWAEKLCELKTVADPDGKKMREKVIGMFLS